MIERERFITGLLGLAELYDKQLGPAAIALYFRALSELDDAAWERAVLRAAERCRFMPRPSELLELARDTSDGDRAIVAFGEAQRAVKQLGAYRSVDFEDKVINATIRGMGGWQRFCALEGDEAEIWGRKEFERQYLAFARALPAELAAHLAGVVELTNSGRGHAYPPPVLIAATTATPRPQRIAAGVRALLEEDTAG